MPGRWTTRISAGHVLRLTYGTPHGQCASSRRRRRQGGDHRALEDTVTLDPIPETWTRALAVVAHPDDLEYGAASAVARWTVSGRSIGYVIVTDGEAGIDTIPPTEAAVLRQKEQLASAEIVGVDD